MKRPKKITLAEMRAAGVRSVLIYCADYRCSFWVRINADHWSDEVRLSDLEEAFICSACGQRGADVRPDWTTSERPKQKEAAGSG